MPGVPEGKLNPVGGEGMDWLALFEREGVQFVVLDRRADRDLVAMLRHQRGWVVDLEDENSVLFARWSR